MSEPEEWRCESNLLRSDTCGEWSPDAEWSETEAFCEDCGSHPAIACPKCDAVFDTVYEDVPTRSAPAPPESAVDVPPTDESET